MTHPAFARLDAAGCPALDAAALEGFAAGPGLRVLLVAGDPAKRPEAVDAAVILVELLKAYPVAAARAAPAAEAAAQSRFGAAVLPCLVFLRDGTPVGKLPGVKDWDAYRAAFDAHLATA
ncbi:thioredoxin domain-containing protein [Paracraurococcus lichenis]|uniref:Hydrogenase expression/formation protein n=1 Tax=Paracraurococcus lichenis TaxID=3064888 RepID=A0ABT9DZI9_9PROT|nr:hypothetical protein [Paracraurococcus sp. LOR1-02]MDO9709327.1 hypothetical protein [Paracraurococcus sp. LOR1-02]